MSATNKRITELTSASAIASDDYIPIDSIARGTKKYKVSEILDMIDDDFDTVVSEMQFSNPPDVYPYNKGDIVWRDDNGTKKIYVAKDDYPSGVTEYDSGEWDEYDTLAEVIKADVPVASEISYDNTTSGLTATDVQNAIDEVVGDIPTTLAELSDDDTHRTVTDTEKTTWSGKQDALTFDNVPTEDSNNPVKSGGIFEEFADKQAQIDINTMKGTVPNLPASTITFSDGANLPMPKLEVAIEPVQSGSGDPSPSNVRPISGWDEVNVSDDAVYGGFIDWNQLAKELNSTNWVAVSSIATYSNGEATLTSSNNSPVAKFLAPFSQTTLNHVYYVYGKGKSDGTSEVGIGVWQDNGGDYSGSTGTGWVTSTSYTNIYKIAKTTAETSIIGARLRNAVPSGNYGVFKDINIIDLTQLFGETKADEIYAMEQAETGSGVAYFKSLFYKDYYPYNSGEITNVSAVNGDTDKYRIYTIDLDGTRYGGKVDLVSGVMTVDRQIVDLGTKDYSFTTYGSATNVFVAYFGNMVINQSSQTYDAMCSDFKVISNDNLYGGADGALAITFTSSDTYAVMRISDSRYNNASAFKTAMNGVKVVYKIATPLTIQLTPTAVKSLQGINNVFADTGDVVEASYVRNATLTINDILARIEALENA